MPALNSLVTQPGNNQPPQIQGSDSQQPSGLQGAVGQQQQQMQSPSHQETAALLQHMSAFRRRWAQMLKDPEIGAKDMRGDVQDMMADMMADEYASLPEVMGLLKTIPTNPLEQKQWIEKHIQSDDQAMRAVMMHHAQDMGPLGDVNNEKAMLSQPMGDRGALVKQAVGRYKAHKKQAPSGQGIPING